MKELLHTLFPGKEETAVPKSTPAAPSPAEEAVTPPREEETIPVVQEIPAPPMPEEDPQHIDALRAELETLRREKHARLLREEAEALLSRQGLDAGFAPFVLGEDLGATRQRAEQFQKLFARALRRELSRRPAPQEPRDLSLPGPAPVCRPGIKRKT